MRSYRRYLVWAAVLTTLGSGLLNLYSVIGPNLPERHKILRELFPLAFLQFSRFLTLLAGFALVVSSINLYKRKQRALQVALGLAILSVFTHLLKGLDFEEASLSAVLVGLLLLARREFSVRSNIPDLRLGLLRFCLALLLAFGYGVAGFWLLEPHEFGKNFPMREAVRETWNILTFSAEPEVAPHSRYAVWFLESLYVMSATALAYAVLSLFRPVAYEFSEVPHQRDLAREIVQAHGRASQDFFKFWPDKSFYFTESRRCVVAYGVAGSFAVALGDPVGPESDIEEAMRGFAAYCRQNDWGLAFYQALPDFLPMYRRQGFRKLKIGDDAIVDLGLFSLEGKSMKKVRYYCNQLEKSGLRLTRYPAPLSGELLAQLRDVSADWLQIPGRRERGFTLGVFEEEYVSRTPVFVVAGSDRRLLAFANQIPSYVPGESTVDLMRYRRDAPNGIMDYLFVRMFEILRNDGFLRFSLGMAPMAGFHEREEASLEEQAIHSFFQNLNFVFSFSGIRQYKAKFATHWEPRYAFYRSPLDLPRLARALQRLSRLEEEE